MAIIILDKEELDNAYTLGNKVLVSTKQMNVHNIPTPPADSEMMIPDHIEYEPESEPVSMIGYPMVNSEGMEYEDAPTDAETELGPFPNNGECFYYRGRFYTPVETKLEKKARKLAKKHRKIAKYFTPHRHNCDD